MVDNKTPQEFGPKVVKNLKHYVYRLVDPRNGETFYVGEGKGGRVFDHIKIDKKKTKFDEESAKLDRIRKIQNAGFEVQHIIHRHGLPNKSMALAVEAALIDAYPGLTNKQRGHDAAYGVIHAQEAIRKYEAKETPIRASDKFLLINVNHSASSMSLYNAVRYSWRLIGAKANSADFVFAVERGLVIGVFVADKWMRATEENFPNMPDYLEKRWGFVGREADKNIAKKYIGTRLPKKYRSGQNPIRYTYK